MDISKLSLNALMMLALMGDKLESHRDEYMSIVSWVDGFLDAGRATECGTIPDIDCIGGGGKAGGGLTAGEDTRSLISRVSASCWGPDPADSRSDELSAGVADCSVP